MKLKPLNSQVNRTLIIVCWVCVVFAFFFRFDPQNYDALLQELILLVIGVIPVPVLIYILWGNSMLRFTRWWKYMLFFAGVTTIGILFKIQHWPIASELFILGCFGIGLFYLIHYACKPMRNMGDHLKVVWILGTLILKCSIFLHWVSRDYMLGEELLYIMMLIYVSGRVFGNFKSGKS